MVAASNSESPEFSGRAVVALATDANAMRHTGRVLVVADLARQYGFTDVDGTTPRACESRVGTAKYRAATLRVEHQNHAARLTNAQANPKNITSNGAVGCFAAG